MVSKHDAFIQEFQAYATEYNDIKAETDEIEEQLEKAIFDLRQLRLVHENLRDDNKISQRHLDTETAKFTKAKLEADTLRSGKEKQSFQIGLLKSEVREFTEKFRELEQDVASLKEGFSHQSQKMIQCSTKNTKLRDQDFLAQAQGLLPSTNPNANEVGF